LGAVSGGYVVSADSELRCSSSSCEYGEKFEEEFEEDEEVIGEGEVCLGGYGAGVIVWKWIVLKRIVLNSIVLKSVVLKIINELSLSVEMEKVGQLWWPGRPYSNHHHITRAQNTIPSSIS